MTQSRRPERPLAYWHAVGADYQAGMKLTDIYLKHDCTKAEFDRQRQRLGWPLRHAPPINRERMIARLLRLVLRHITQLEQGRPGGEKDVALLHQLVATVARLVRTEAVTTPIGQRRRRTASLNGIREKLVARIEELKRG
jgi:hypothetical protein